MVKIKNIKIEESSFFKKTDAAFKKCLEYAKLVNPNAIDLLPVNTKYTVTFELTDTCTELANCIRRSLIDEVPVFSMTIDDTNIDTDDMFILSDFIKKNIELVPITQELKENDIADLQLTLNVKNTKDTIIPVHSGAIEVYNTKTKKKLNTADYFSTGIILIYLRPTFSLHLKSIKIDIGRGKTHGGKYSYVANTLYEVMDIKPLIDNKYETKGESCLNSNPTHYKVGYKTYRNIAPKHVMIKCCAELISKFENISKELQNIKKTDVVYISDLIELETSDSMSIYHLKSEYWTASNIISKYCFIAFKDIEFVCSSIIHPSTEESLVKIKHPQSLDIIQKAIKNIIADINTIYKAFK
jgi:DNA-directed RNA polymerase subunit L